MAPNPTQLRMWLAVPGQSDYFHVIPAIFTAITTPRKPNLANFHC